jgi:SAM-dependent methyltransferase
MTAKSKEPMTCWICGGTSWKAFKTSTLNASVTSEDFKITDAHYGRTGRIDQCLSCGFRQCGDLDSVLGFYEDLEDPAYDQGREQRALQARKIIEAVQPFTKGRRLLDVGAASGILLECAQKLGFQGEGIEPSKHLARRAQESGLNVHLGTFPHPAVKGQYDLITLVDVIEHVPDPVQLLKDIASHLKPDGVGVLTTPDVQSHVARLLGPRWWHFRVAHIGYFSRDTLELALQKAGLSVLKVSCPPWYFTMQYAGDRALTYAPSFLRFKMPGFTQNWTIRVNFRDSLQIIFRRASPTNEQN